VVLTGSGDPWLALAALKLGAQDILVKGQMESRSLVRAVVYAVTRHRTLETARDSEANLRSVLENASDGLVIVDSRGTVVYASPSAKRLIGGGDRAVDKALFGLRLVEGVPSELALVNDKGDEKILEVRVTEVRWQRRYARLLALRDLSERRRSEKLHERLVETDRLAIVGQLSLGLAREINYPARRAADELSQVSATIQQLRSGYLQLHSAALSSPDPVVAALARQVAEECQFEQRSEVLDDVFGRCWEHVARISDVVHDFLMLTRSSAEVAEPIDLDELIIDATNTLRDALRDGVRLTSSRGKLQPVQGDRSRLSLVVTSLLFGLVDSGGPDGQGCTHVHIVSRQREGSASIQFVGTGKRTGEGPSGRRGVSGWLSAPDALPPGTWPGIAFARDVITDMGGSVSSRVERGRTILELSLPTKVTAESTSAAAS